MMLGCITSRWIACQRPCPEEKPSEFSLRPASVRGWSAHVMCSMSPPSACIRETRQRLVRILEELRDLGNTIVVVEHDPDVMRSADHIVDLGPGAGEHGGKVLFSGTYGELMSDGAASLTSRYLKGEKTCRNLDAPPEASSKTDAESNRCSRE